MNTHPYGRRIERRELGVDLVLWVRPEWTEIVATGPYTDRASIFDHLAFFDARTARTELRNAMRRHARAVKAIADGRRSAF